MSIRFTFTIFSSLAMWCGSGLAQSPPDSATEPVSELISSVLEEEQAPGASVAVVLDGSLWYAQGFGVADLEDSAPATPETVYRIASISKMITATGAMQLVENDRLDLMKAVQSYCPAFPERNHPITPHHLLAHQAGIRHWLTTSERLNRTEYPSIVASLEVFKDDALLFEPGTREEYSTPGYNIVGCAMEGASGMDYDEYMRKNIFTPANMESAFVGDAPEDHPHKASGYRFGPDGPRPARKDNLTIKLPGGGLSGSVLDLAHFAVALYSGELLSEESRREMWTAKKLSDGTVSNKGYGCNIGEEKGRKVIWHIGGVSGFSGVLYLYPERRAAVALLFNMEAQPVFPTASSIMDYALDAATASE